LAILGRCRRPRCRARRGRMGSIGSIRSAIPRHHGAALWPAPTTQSGDARQGPGRQVPSLGRCGNAASLGIEEALEAIAGRAPRRRRVAFGAWTAAHLPGTCSPPYGRAWHWLRRRFLRSGPSAWPLGLQADCRLKVEAGWLYTGFDPS